MAVPPYASPPELQSRLPSGGGAYTATETGVHQAALDALSRAVDGKCRRTFYRATRTMVFTATDPMILEVPDLVSVTTLKTDTTSDGTYDRTWATADYHLRPTNAATDEPKSPYTRIDVSFLNGSNGYTFPVGTQNGVQIGGVWGWPEVPDAVRELTVLAALNFLQQLGAPSGTVSNDVIGAYIVSPAFTKLADLMLIPYVRKGLSAAVGGGY